MKTTQPPAAGADARPTGITVDLTKTIDTGHADTEGEAAELFEHLNCPTCGGSGHADDATPSTSVSEHLAVANAEPGEAGERASIDLAYSTGFSDARGLAALHVWNHDGPLDRKTLHDGIRAIIGPSTEAGWDGAEMPLTLALEQIDGEAPAKEPRDGPTVGFPPSRDPEADDGNEVVREAFDEGVSRGRWEAAKIAREALAAIVGSNLV